MKGTASLFVFLVAAVAAESFTYSYNNHDVKQLELERPSLVFDEPLQARDMPKEEDSHLLPAIHPHLDRRDMQHLHSRQAASLFYTENGGICAFLLDNILLP